VFTASDFSELSLVLPLRSKIFPLTVSNERHVRVYVYKYETKRGRSMYIYIRKHTYIHTRGYLCICVRTRSSCLQNTIVHYKFIFFFFPLFSFTLPSLPLYNVIICKQLRYIFFLYIYYIIVSSSWFCSPRSFISRLIE